jgi:DNA repair protein RecO (recombination protein O)
MPLSRDSAICMRLVPYSETSQIVTLLTREHGLLRLIAKGAHRRTKAGAGRFDGGLDLLDVGSAVFSAPTEKSLGLLTEWKLLDGNLGLRRSLRSLRLAMLVAEVVPLLFQEHDPHPTLYDRVVATVAALSDESLEESSVAFLLDLLHESGFVPELARCSACGQTVTDKPRAFFSPERGGVLCEACGKTVADRMTVDPKLLRLLQMLLKLPRENGQVLRLPRLTRVQSDPLHRLLLTHLEHTLQRPLRMKPLVTTGDRAVGVTRVV